MSKDTFVKAAAQGGDSSGGGGGGLPGTWTLVDHGSVTVNQNSTIDMVSVPLPTDIVTLYMMIVTPMNKSPGGDISISEGQTVTAPPNNCLHHSMIISGTSDLTFRVRAGVSLPGVAVDLNWALYKVILP